MPKSFDPTRLRQLAQGNEAFTKTLPPGFLEIFEIIRFSNESDVECGNGLRALGKVATDFLYSGPKSLEDTIAADWSSAHDLVAPLQSGELSITGEKVRPKKIAEYNDEESRVWTRFMDGLDPSDTSITRDTAVKGLCGLAAGMNSRIGGVSNYSLSLGENGLVFDRAKAILRGTPFIIAMSVLPDMVSNEASRIFSIPPNLHPQVVNEFIEAAKGPIYEAPRS